MYFWHGKTCRYKDKCSYVHTHKLVKNEVKSVRALKRDKEEKKRLDDSDSGSYSSVKVNTKLKKANVRNENLVKENKELKAMQRKNREQVEIDSHKAHEDIQELDDEDDDEDDN
jgi:hypothetical protein